MTQLDYKYIVAIFMYIFGVNFMLGYLMRYWVNRNYDVFIHFCEYDECMDRGF